MYRPFGPPTGRTKPPRGALFRQLGPLRHDGGMAGDRAPTALDCNGGPRTRCQGVDDRNLSADDRDRTAEDRDQLSEAHDKASEARDERAQARDRISPRTAAS